MNQQNKQQILMELVWWLITAIIVFLVVRPIWNAFNSNDFLIMNVVFVAVFITLARYIFFLKHTFIAYSIKWKMVLMLICLPLIFYLIQGNNNFQDFIDRIGLQSYESALNPDFPKSQFRNLMTYMRQEMLFFGVGSTIVAVIFFFRMLISIWRNYNIGTA